MRNLLLILRFDGQAYHGWQVQPNGITVQQCVHKSTSCTMMSPQEYTTYLLPIVASKSGMTSADALE